MSVSKETTVPVGKFPVAPSLARPGHSPPKLTIDTTLDLPVLVRMLRRRKWLLVICILTVTPLALAIANLMSPLYKATAVIMVEPEQINLGSIENVISNLDANKDGLKTQVEIIRSHRVSSRVVDRLGLVDHPDFNPHLQPPSLMDRVTVSIANATAFGSAPRDEPFSREYLKQATIDALQESLDLRLQEGTRVIEIVFTSRNPQLAADVANALAAAYAEDQMEAKFESYARAQRWLSERVSELRDNVRKAESAVEEYRSRTGLTRGVTSTLGTEQISQMNRELIQARSAMALAQSRLSQVHGILSTPEGLAALPEVLQSNSIRDLRIRQAELLNEEAELASRVLEAHPTLVNVRSQLQSVKQSIDQEIQRIKQGLQNEASAAEAHVNQLTAELAELREQASRASEAEVELRVLERELEAGRSLLALVLKHGGETSEQFKLKQPDAQLLTPAVVPEQPFSPNKTLIVTLAFMFSVFLGLLLILLRELLEQAVQSTEDVEARLGARCLGIVPEIAKPNLRQSRYDYVIARPMSAFTEAIRCLWASLLVLDRTTSVMITSSKPGESKTLTAVSLARAAALGGETVILVDCDLRAPAIHKVFKSELSPGLADVLAGRHTLQEVIREDRETGLRYVTAGVIESGTIKLMMSAPMQELIETLETEYQFVVLDAPPVLAVSEVRVMAVMCRAVVFCVKWNETPARLAASALGALADAGATIAGVALSQVNVKKHAENGYGNSGIYYGEYSKYYNT